jgi:CBS domain-containing protein
MSILGLCGIKLCKLGPDDTVLEAARHMREENVGSIVVQEEDEPVGILTDRDIAVEVLARGLDPSTPLHDVMSRPVTWIEESASPFEALRTMREHCVRRLPVVDADGKLRGIVSMDDFIVLLGREVSRMGDLVRSAIGD